MQGSRAPVVPLVAGLFALTPLTRSPQVRRANAVLAVARARGPIVWMGLAHVVGVLLAPAEVTMTASETRNHDPLEFQRVYDEFHPRIRRYLERLVGSTDAEDVTQDTFAKVSQALPQFREDSSLSTWIYRIATNAAYDRLRSRSSRGGPDVPIDDQPAVEDKSPGADQRFARREMNECIDDYIARLPSGYRSVVILSEHEGLTNKEIADALGVTLDTVKIRLHRARARLRKDLGDGCDFYRDDRNEFACDSKPTPVSRRD